MHPRRSDPATVVTGEVRDGVFGVRDRALVHHFDALQDEEEAVAPPAVVDLGQRGFRLPHARDRRLVP